MEIVENMFSLVLFRDIDSGVLVGASPSRRHLPLCSQNFSLHCPKSSSSIEAQLTSAGVSGAVMEPSRPTMEEKANRLWRYLVGYSSAVYTYTDVITMAMQYLPNRYSASCTPSLPEAHNS